MTKIFLEKLLLLEDLCMKSKWLGYCIFLFYNIKNNSLRSSWQWDRATLSILLKLYDSSKNLSHVCGINLRGCAKAEESLGGSHTGHAQKCFSAVHRPPWTQVKIFSCTLKHLSSSSFSKCHCKSSYMVDIISYLDSSWNSRAFYNKLSLF